VLFELAQILSEGGAKLLFWPRLNHGYEVAPVTRLSVAPWLLLLFALGGNEVRYRLLLVQTEEFRISSNKSLIKDSARQLFEVLIFKRLQCARADLRRPGDLLQRYTAEFALTPEFVPESSHNDRPLALICV